MKALGKFFFDFYHDVLHLLHMDQAVSGLRQKRGLIAFLSPVILSLGLFVYLLLGVVLVSTGCSNVTEFYSSELQDELSEQLLRFHVIANSDSDTDQEIKMKVKEEVILYLEPYLSDADDKEEAMDIISGQLESLTDMANEVLSDNGFAYEAKASLSSTTFPVKVYGDITLPPGEYDALRIELGEAQGKNWWCIMYPQLCFIDSTYTVVPDESKSKLKYVLTEEEYNAILSDDVEVVPKLKIVEWFEALFD